MPDVDPIDYWNNEGGERWKANAARLAVLFAPLTQRLMRFARPGGGERILDVGCGTGGTTIELARRVGPAGRVLGLDVSRTLFSVAQEALEGANAPNAQLICADAAAHDFGDERFDLLFSQFGVMFFSDPVSAFANLRRALMPKGRLAFACWREMQVNPCFSVSLEAAKPFAPPLPPPPPDAPGPFAFHDPNRVERILSDAGFSQIQIVPHDEELLFGNSSDIATIAERSANMGPTARLLAEASRENKEAAVKAIAEAYRRCAGPSELRLGAGVWLVSASAA